MKSLLIIVLAALICVSCSSDRKQNAPKPPNILIAISDDQSFPHASAYGYKGVNTPNFDRIAKQGVLFNNAYVASPGCSPSRAALLTGLYPWQIEEAGTHASFFPAKFKVLPDILEDEANYFTGFTGKGWAPGDWANSGRDRNPAGTEFNDIHYAEEIPGISTINYTENFTAFLKEKPSDRPFLFWYGAHEPHRVYEDGVGELNGKKTENISLPGFLPNAPEINSDMMDYAYEIEWFDKHLGEMLKTLEKVGELDNTIIIVTADNGMPFPRAKANCYDFGIHVPLAIFWPNQVKANRKVDDLISLVDIAPTLLDILGVDQVDYNYSGHSFKDILLKGKSELSNPDRLVFSSRERHSYSRYNNLGYPQRAIRYNQYLLIWNMKSERWPAGAPQKYLEDGSLEENHMAYQDIDHCPSLTYLVNNRLNEDTKKYFHLAVDKRPELELFNVELDPDCINNLANDLNYKHVKDSLFMQLKKYLKETGDPRVHGNGNIWESYPRLRGPMRRFPKPKNDN